LLFVVPIAEKTASLPSSSLRMEFSDKLSGERRDPMTEQQLVFDHSLQLLVQRTGRILPEPGVGAVLARAGGGKTSFLVQLALHGLLRGEKVVHVSLDQPVRKVTLWYEEVFHALADQFHLERANSVWKAIVPNRFIMTFHSQQFSLSRLEERICELQEQNILHPHLVVIDAFCSGELSGLSLDNLKRMAREGRMSAWFGVRADHGTLEHSCSVPEALGLPSGLLDVVLVLETVGLEVVARPVVGAEARGFAEPLTLDTSTLLIKDRADSAGKRD